MRTNIDAPGLDEDLGFVPRRAGLTSDEDLFRLVIADLYGNTPAVAGRELVQNAIDAVKERWLHEQRTATSMSPDLFRRIDSDVSVTVEPDPCAGGEFLLRVRDRGIGMSPSTVADYFLKAGASLGSTTDEDLDLAADHVGASIKTGRFGIGAFAGFLLGPSVEVRTRHVEEERGIAFAASLDSDLVEMLWVDDEPFGTEVVIRFTANDIREAPVEFLSRVASSYCMRLPSVSFEVTGGTDAGIVEQKLMAPGPGEELGEWRRLNVPDFDDVLWSATDYTTLIHNGMRVAPLREAYPSWGYRLHRSDLHQWVRRVARCVGGAGRSGALVER